jgi:hypothetical protein
MATVAYDAVYETMSKTSTWKNSNNKKNKNKKRKEEENNKTL